MQPDQFNLKTFNYAGWDPALTGKVVFAEYIWIDGSGKNLRSKTKIVNGEVNSVSDLDWWTFDGSSCEMATTTQSEIWLKPVCFVKDPIRKENSILVMCETFLPDKETPARCNFRHLCQKVMEEAKEEQPWFGVEQEFQLMVRQGTTQEWPLGWPSGGFPYPQGQYYCSVGESNAFGRAVIETAVRYCVSAGLKIAGINAEVAPGQWEYQVGIAEGMECGDHLWLSRYIMSRVGEEFGVCVNIEPKPVKGNWNGAGCHCNFSTVKMREQGGLNYMLEECMEKLAAKHKEHITLYGEGNEQRLTGQHETSSIDKFSFGQGNRAASIRIPVYTYEKGYGYLEDRRPSSNIDPYLVSAILVDTICLNSKYCEQLLEAYKNSKENNF